MLDQSDRRVHRRQRRKTPTSAGRAGRGPRVRQQRRAARRSRRDHRIHPHGHAAARRRRRRLDAAPRPRNCERGLGQRGQRAGRRLRVLALVRDDGVARQHARDGRDGRRDQQDRRGRGSAAAQRERRGHDAGALLRGHLPKNREVVRIRRADRRDPRRARRPRSKVRWRAMAGISAPHFS